MQLRLVPLVLLLAALPGCAMLTDDEPAASVTVEVATDMLVETVRETVQGERPLLAVDATGATIGSASDGGLTLELGNGTAVLRLARMDPTVHASFVIARKGDGCSIARDGTPDVEEASLAAGSDPTTFTFTGDCEGSVRLRRV